MFSDILLDSFCYFLKCVCHLLVMFGGCWEVFGDILRGVLGLFGVCFGYFVAPKSFSPAIFKPRNL